MKYRVAEGIDMADIAYEVYGKTIEELFINAAQAVTQTMVDLASVKSVVSCQLSVVSSKLEDLLLDFLNEIVFYKDSKGLLFSKFKIKMSKKEGKFFLEANLLGEKVDIKKHKLRCDVKAVARHKFSLKKAVKTYQAIIVLDI